MQMYGGCMDIAKLQRLVGLEFGEEEAEELGDDLDELRASIDRLETVDVDGVEPAVHPVRWPDPSGDGETDKPLTVGEALENAPEHRDDYFDVPAGESTDDASS